MKKAMKLCGPLAGVMLYAFATTAWAQDSSAQDARKKSDKEEAAQTAPTWESFGAGSEETLEETFFRLSRDFTSGTEGGIRRLGSVPIWPRGDVKIAGIRFLPYLREGVEWDRNIYLQPETGPGNRGRGKQYEWTHINEAGLLGATALMGGRLNVAAFLDSIWNIHYDASALNAWDFDGQLGATYHLPSKAWVAGGIKYQRRHDPVDLPLDVVNDTTGVRTRGGAHRRDFGRSNSGAFFNFGFDKDIFFGTKIKWEFGVQVDHSMATDDQVFGTLDRTETTYYGKVSYPFFKNTTNIFLLARDRVQNRDSARVNDGNTWGLSAGLEGSIPLTEGEYRSIRGQVSVGFDRSLYDNQTFQVSNQTLQPDDTRRSTNANIQAILQYIMSPRSTVDLRYLHQTEFSFRGNYQVVDNVQLSFSHNFTRTLSGRVETFYEHTNPSGHNQARVVNISGTGLSPADLQRQINQANALLSNAHDVNREGIGFGARYAFNDWMDVDASVDWENRNDHQRNSFRNYRGVLGLTFYLNALTPRSRASAEH